MASAIVLAVTVLVATALAVLVEVAAVVLSRRGMSQLVVVIRVVVLIAARILNHPYTNPQFPQNSRNPKPL